MREILFRAKEKESGEWVHGYYSEHTICGDETYISPVIEKAPKGIYDYQSWVVDPKTVGQYIGLKDKNGTKIFEGDIVGFAHGGNCLAYVRCDEGCFEVRNDKQDVLLYVSVVAHKNQVIGNIHDNPELLEVN